MSYTSILQRAFNIVRHEPALWVLGIIFALFGGEGGRMGMNWNQPASQGFDGPTTGGVPPALPEWFNLETLLPLAIGAVILLLCFGLVAFVLRTVALAGLIQGTEHASAGSDVRWAELWRAGLSPAGRRLMGMKVLLALPIGLLALLLLSLFAAGMVPLFQAMGTANEPTSATVGILIGAGLTLLCLLPLLFGLDWLLGLVANYAARAIVVEKRPVMEAVRQGWRLVRDHITHTLVFSIILGVVGVVAQLVIGAILVLVAILLGAPLFFFLDSQGFPIALTLVSIVSVGFIVWLLASALIGPLLAYYETAWTLMWQQLSRGKDALPEMPLAAETL